jgi:hypothetical protein
MFVKQILAAGIEIGPNLSLGNGSNIADKYTDFASLVTLLLRNGLTVAGIIFLGLILFGGVSFIASAGTGDQKKLAQAQAAITNALIGFLVIFLSYFIIQIIEVLTGLQIL